MYIEKIKRADLDRLAKDLGLKIEKSRLRQVVITSDEGPIKGYYRYKAGHYNDSRSDINLYLKDFSCEAHFRFEDSYELTEKDYCNFMVNALPKELRAQYIKDYSEFWANKYKEDYNKNIKDLNNRKKHMIIESKNEKNQKCNWMNGHIRPTKSFV